MDKNQGYSSAASDVYKRQGYEIIKAVMLENGRGFALGHNPAAPSPYVTWACLLYTSPSPRDS